MTAAALVVVPWMLGLQTARLGRRLVTAARPRRALFAALASALLLAPFIVLPLSPCVSVYDALVVACLFAGASLAVAWPTIDRPTRPGLWLLSGAILLGGLYGVERWAEAHPVARTWGVSRSLSFLFRRDQRDTRTAVVYAPVDGRGPSYHYRNLPLPPSTAPHRVLHLGDSMLAAAEVGDDRCFTSLLERDRPGETHYNLGADGTGPDVHYVQLLRFFARTRPHEIIHHVFPGNDVSDIDRPYVFCDGGPLLDESHPPAWRCPEPRWRVDVAELLRFGPPPYPLRVLAQNYALAERIEFFLEARLSPRRLPVDVERNLGRLRDILAATAAFARSRGVPYHVVVLPVRSTFRYDYFVPREHVVEAVRAAGVESVDTQRDFDAALAAEPARRWFQPSPANPHFDVDGHRFYATWLERHVLGGQTP